MTHTGPKRTYEVVLGPAAIRTIQSIGNHPDRAELDGALSTELLNGPNTGKELRFDSDIRAYKDSAASSGGVIYTATPLSVSGYTAIHRPLAENEIKQLRGERSSPIADQGFYLIDILPAESAFTRGPLLL